MTFLKTIEPHILSDDVLIRETVLNAIHDYPNVPENWTLKLLEEGFRQKDKLTSILLFLPRNSINEEIVTLLIENLPHIDKNIVHIALRLVDNIEPELAVKYKEQLTPFLDSSLWELYDLLINGNKEEVYSEYGKVLNELEDLQYHSHEPFHRAKLLAKRIVKNDWVTDKEIRIILNEQLEEKWFSYEGILAVYMAGLMKLEEHIPFLASLLSRDEDVLLEEVSASLVSFQSDEVVKAVTPYLAKEDSIIFATSVLENIKSELAVKSLMEAYEKIKDLEYQDIVIEALCYQYSIDALPVIEKHMKKRYRSTFVDIEMVAYSYFKVLGLDHPNLEHWQVAALKSDQDMEETPRTPIVVENKVGRNDPCICGSGKKYKKCCGN